MSFPSLNTLFVNYRQQGRAGSKTLLQQNPPVLSWRCQLTQVDLFNSRKTVVVIVLVASSTKQNCALCDFGSCGFTAVAIFDADIILLWEDY